MNALWSIFTNNGMYSDTETIVGLVLSVIGSFLIMRHAAIKSGRELKETMIRELGYERYMEIINNQL